ncbi:MAG: carboxymuconolactone decarboxylase family protein [Bryobacteraceae bacterium]|nr:carboxymuconolactone decarboxylase family protein [Bryobacteraceae bacterium]
MTYEAFLDSIPEYAKDLKLNLTSLLKQAELTEQQTWGTVIASVMGARQTKMTTILLAEAAKFASPETQNAAKTAAAIMGMNNVYYRFTHMFPDDTYSSIPARLRMNGIRTHGGDPLDFELYCTVVSAINNCTMCVTSHERVLREKGCSKESIAAAVRLGAVLHALALVFDTEWA